MKIGNKLFDDKKTYVMGILNITPDSFSDGGKYTDVSKALYGAQNMISEGAVVIDVGGESTRPGYTKISDEEEIERILPVISKIKSNFDVCVSVDTYKSEVAKCALECGADMINDIHGLKYNIDMSKIISRYDASCCIMHNRNNTQYIDFFEEVISDLEGSIELAKKAGISDDKIIIDPGVGFAKSYEQNLEVINKLDMLRKVGYPVLLGASRKSVIGNTLNLPEDDRLEGTLATTAVAVMKGCHFVRVHDVKENIRVIKMIERIQNGDN